jgi:predicted Fe-Mo cluster-binding NifX family protein
MNERVAMAIEENELIERVAEHFSKCTKFKVFELDDEKTLIKTETYFNPLVGEHNGACQLPGYVKQFNVNTIIAGGMGKKAVDSFQSFGINVITAPGLDYKAALNLFIEGKIVGYEACEH